MSKKSGTSKAAADKLVKNVHRKTRQTYSAEEKICIVLAGLRGEENIFALCRREDISERRGVLQPRQGRLRGKSGATFQKALAGDLEGRIMLVRSMMVRLGSCA